jgi:hypothetical protein
MVTKEFASPLQVVMIGFDGPAIPDKIRDATAELRNDQDVRLVDALMLTRGASGAIEWHDLPDLKPAEPEAEGTIRTLLDRARSGPMLGENTLSGPPPNQRGVLFRADPLPDPRDLIPRGSQEALLLLLLEHRWGARLRHAVAEVGAYPIGSNWLNAATVHEVGLPAPPRT